MLYKDIIEKIKPIPYSKYKNISSYEKLAVYAAAYLDMNNIPLFFNYICIAAFKFFPDKFCCDEEFKEYPSVDRLNRTVLHMHSNKNQNNYLTGTVKNGFKLTELGRIVAKKVSDEIINGEVDIKEKAPIVDMHKKGFIQEYRRFIDSELFADYLKTKKVNLNLLWKLFRVIPFSRVNKIQNELKNIEKYAMDQNDENCINCINEIIKQL